MLKAGSNASDQQKKWVNSIDTHNNDKILDNGTVGWCGVIITTRRESLRSLTWAVLTLKKKKSHLLQMYF